MKKKTKNKIVNAVDLFCGAGGTSTGLIHAVNELGYEIKLTAINHWDVAIATHSKNHEEVEHYCQAIESLNPTDVISGGRLQLMVASPSCTHHSRARGGKPSNDQKRADPWLLLRWIDQLYIENILIENVPEMMSWGPLTAKGRPDKRYKGQYFEQFISALKINYNVEYRVLNCADYGDPTTRQRFFLLARRPKHKPIVWPERTHASRKEIAKLAAQPGLFGEDKKLKPWVPARNIIDWSLEGKSIFNRKRPLSPNTMRRIFAGLMKYSLKPFIVPQHSSNAPRSVDQPCPTITTTSRGVGVVEPFLFNNKGSQRGSRSIEEPAFAQTTSNHQHVVEVEKIADAQPFIFNMAHTGKNAADRDNGYCKDTTEPLPTVAGKGMFGLIEPFLISAGGPQLEAKSVEEPMRTVLTRDHQALVEAFLVKFHGGKHADQRNYPIDEPIKTVDTSNRFGLVETEAFTMSVERPVTNRSLARSVEEPIATVTGNPRIALFEPYIVSTAHGGNTNPPRDINEPLGSVLGTPKFAVAEPFVLGQQSGSAPRTTDEPLPTIAGAGAIALAEPYIVKFYGNEKGAESINEPLDTVTTKDRFGLCIPSIGAVVDIRFRMLQPHELAAAMSFPDDYEFTGTKENVVKQIGNAVPLKTAKALCKSLLG